MTKPLPTWAEVNVPPNIPDHKKVPVNMPPTKKGFQKQTGICATSIKVEE